jgi:hypothetical protein
MKQSLTAFLSWLLLVVGCSDADTDPINQPESEVAEVETITDPDTEPVIDTVGELNV